MRLPNPDSNRPQPMTFSEAESVGTELKLARLANAAQLTVKAIKALDGEASMPLDLARQLASCCEILEARINEC